MIPRESKTYFGTTDTDYQGDFNHPTVEQEDVDYLLKIVNLRYPEANLTIEDIEASWAGLRPLISDAGGDYNGTVKGKSAMRILKKSSERRKIILTGNSLVQK